MFKFRRQKKKNVRRSKKRIEQKFVYKKNQIPAGQYCFPFTIKLPERNKDGKFWPSSSMYDCKSSNTQFRIVWRLQFAFNRSFFESPLSLTRNLQLVF